MGLCTVLERQRLDKFIPAILVFCDVMPYEREYRLLIPFDLPTRLGMLRGSSQMLQSEEPT